MKLVSAAALFLITTSVHAQLSYGPKLGLNFSKISFSNDNYKTSFRPGFFAGGFANYAIAGKLSLQLEAVYSADASNESEPGTGDKGHVSFNYLNVPLLAQYRFTSNWFAEAGPQVGLLVSAKDKYEGGNESVKQYYKSTEFRVPVGVGYKFNDPGVKGLTVNLRYAFSLSPMNKVRVGGTAVKMQVFSLGAAITL